MAELELKEDRLISGTGVVRLPEDIEDPRYLRLCIDVVRKVPEPFGSNKYTPQRSRYATCSFMRDGYVIAEATVDYERRCFDFVSDIAGQALIAIKCAYKGILETFVNLGNALNLIPFIIANNIEDYEHLNLFWDEAVVTCEGSTALQARLYVLEHDDDCESSDPFKPPPPEPPLPPVPPNTSIGSISPPYPDDDFTSPNPLDEFLPEPPIGGEDCLLYNVTVRYFSVGNNDFRTATAVSVYGPFWGVREVFAPSPDLIGVGENSQLQLECRGRVPGACGDRQWVRVTGSGNTNAYGVGQSEIITITPL